MKKNYNLFLILMFLIGFSLLTYPIISNYINSFSQSKAVSTYESELLNMDTNDYLSYWEDANKFNNTAISETQWLFLNDENKNWYYKTLDITGNGMIGYIEIDKLGLKLPIYHGTGEEVLQSGIGHIEGSSLPVGGVGTHCLLSGHRGLPSAILFSDLDQLEVGDKFLIHILGETLTYQVYEVNIVLPNEVSSLELEKGLDLCTLITCTPYGVNSHRLLVHGNRIENDETIEILNISANALKVDLIFVIPFIAIPFLLVLFVVFIISDAAKKNKKKIEMKEREMKKWQEK